MAECPSIEFSARALLPVKLSNILAASNIGVKHSIEEVHDWELGFRNAVKKIGVPLPQDDDDFELAFDGSEAAATSLQSSIDSHQFTPTMATAPALRREYRRPPESIPIRSFFAKPHEADWEKVSAQ